MKVLIDTNIILDHLLARAPFNTAAAWIFSQTEKGKLATFIGATTVTTVHYLVTKALGSKASYDCMGKLLRLFEIAPITRTVLASALLLKFTDFEDAVLHEAAIHAGVTAIISRDLTGFRKATLPVYLPDAFMLSTIQKQDG